MTTQEPVSSHNDRRTAEDCRSSTSQPPLLQHRLESSLPPMHGASTSNEETMRSPAADEDTILEASLSTDDLPFLSLSTCPRRNIRIPSLRQCDRTVTFSTVEFHYHSILVGDNPAVLSGPPLTIAWKADETIVMSVDDYEAHQQQQQQESGLGHRRSPAQLNLSGMERTCLLQRQGYPRSVIQAASKQAETDRQLRLQSNRHLQWDATQLRVEQVSRKLSNLFRGRKNPKRKGKKTAILRTTATTTKPRLPITPDTTLRGIKSDKSGLLKESLTSHTSTALIEEDWSLRSASFVLATAEKEES